MTGAELSEPYGALLSEQLIRDVEKINARPASLRGRGSSVDRIVDIMGRFSNPQVLEGWEQLLHAPQRKRPQKPAPRRKAGARPYGAVRRLVTNAVTDIARPVLPSDVRGYIEQTTGEQLPASSVKASLMSGSRRAKGAFIRETDGYRLRDELSP